jgi:hypothetical protein
MIVRSICSPPHARPVHHREQHGVALNRSYLRSRVAARADILLLGNGFMPALPKFPGTPASRLFALGNSIDFFGSVEITPAWLDYCKPFGPNPDESCLLADANVEGAVARSVLVFDDLRTLGAVDLQLNFAATTDGLLHSI